MADEVDELYRAGYASLKATDWMKALEAFDTALKLLPPDDPNGPAELLNFKGLALAGLGRHAEALMAHKAALAAGPRSPEFLADLGDTLAALGKRQAAIAAYEEALANTLPGEELLERIRAGLENARG